MKWPFKRKESIKTEQKQTDTPNNQWDIIDENKNKDGDQWASMDRPPIETEEEILDREPLSDEERQKLSEELGVEIPPDVVDISHSNEASNRTIKNAKSILDTASQKRNNAVVGMELDGKYIRSDMTEEEMYLTVYGKDKDAYEKMLSQLPSKEELLTQQPPSEEERQKLSKKLGVEIPSGVIDISDGAEGFINKPEYAKTILDAASRRRNGAIVGTEVAVGARHFYLSSDMTEDEMCIAWTGKTKAEIDAENKQRQEKLDEEERERQANIEKEIPERINAGLPLIYKKRQEEWKKAVEDSYRHGSGGASIDSALEVMQALDDGVTAEKAYEIVDKNPNNDNAAIITISNLVLRFSKRGPEYFIAAQTENGKHRYESLPTNIREIIARQKLDNAMTELEEIKAEREQS